MCSPEHGKKAGRIKRNVPPGEDTFQQCYDSKFIFAYFANNSATFSFRASPRRFLATITLFSSNTTK